MRVKGICDVEIDEISVEAVPVEEPACEVELN